MIYILRLVIYDYITYKCFVDSRNSLFVQEGPRLRPSSMGHLVDHVIHASPSLPVFSNHKSASSTQDNSISLESTPWVLSFDNRRVCAKNPDLLICYYWWCFIRCSSIHTISNLPAILQHHHSAKWLAFLLDRRAAIGPSIVCQAWRCSHSEIPSNCLKENYN